MEREIVNLGPSPKPNLFNNQKILCSPSGEVIFNLRNPVHCEDKSDRACGDGLGSNSKEIAQIVKDQISNVFKDQFGQIMQEQISQLLKDQLNNLVQSQISARSDASGVVSQSEHLRQTLKLPSPFRESSNVSGEQSFSNAKPESVDRGFSVTCTGWVDSSPLGLNNVCFPCLNDRMGGPTDYVERPRVRFENFGSVTNTRYAPVEEYEHLQHYFSRPVFRSPQPFTEE